MRVDAELWQEIANGGESALDQRLSKVVRAAHVERDRLLAAREQARDAVALIDKGLGRVNRILRAAGHDPDAKKKTKRKSAAPQVSEETVATVLHALAAKHNEGATVKDLVEATSLNNTTIRKSLNVLREKEEVRLAGTRKTNRQPAALFKVMSDGHAD